MILHKPMILEVEAGRIFVARADPAAVRELAEWRQHSNLTDVRIILTIQR